MVETKTVGDRESDLIRILSTFSPWWETGNIPNVEKFQRRDFHWLTQKITEKGAIALVGARQVGKTTLIEQLIEHLLSIGTPPQRILMVHANNRELNTVSNNVIKDCLDVYEKYVLGESITRTQSKVYVFIDEIQRVDKWFEIVRDYYDINKNIKFVVSGSSSARIISESTKALVGRVENQIVVPFKFLEALRYYNFRIGKTNDNSVLLSGIPQIRNEINRLMEITVTKRKLSNVFSMLENKYKNLLVLEKTIKFNLDQYFIKGGYPAIIKEENLRICIDKLSTNIRDVINTDIVQLRGIRDLYAMERLLVLLSKDSSDNVNLKSMADNIEKDVKTVSEYVKYLEDTFIISVSENYSYSKSKRTKKKIKKIFFNDIGLRNVLNNTFNEKTLQDPNLVGKIAETVVHDHCVRLKFKISPQFKPELYYWRDNDGEIDIVFEHKGRAIPIEVKYRGKIDGDDLKNIKRFIKKYKSGFGICVSKDTLELRDNILIIPAWLFLILC